MISIMQLAIRVIRIPLVEPVECLLAIVSLTIISFAMIPLVLGVIAIVCLALGVIAMISLPLAVTRMAPFGMVSPLVQLRLMELLKFPVISGPIIFH